MKTHIYEYFEGDCGGKEKPPVSCHGRVSPEFVHQNALHFLILLTPGFLSCFSARAQQWRACEV